MFKRSQGNTENVRGCKQSRMLDACLYTDLKETKDNRHALFFAPDTKYMEFLLDVDEFSMLYSSTPRRESCL